MAIRRNQCDRNKLNNFFFFLKENKLNNYVSGNENKNKNIILALRFILNVK
jgi:hypothetical protein